MCSCRQQRCCFCCTLRTGSLVIGTLGWISSTIVILAVLGLFGGTEGHKANLVIFFVISYSSLSMLICLMVIWGVYKNDQRYLLPYLVLKFMESAVMFCIFFLHVWTVMNSEFKSLWYAAGILHSIIFCFILLQWYFWLCVWSYYRELEERSPSPAIHYLDTPVSSMYAKASETAV